MKLLPGTKIAIGFASLVAAYYVGYPAYMKTIVRGIPFPPIVPDRIVMLGVPRGTKIVVANNVAVLVEASEDFEGAESAEGGVTQGAITRRIPMQEMLGVFRGEGVALGELVMKMNDVKRNGDDWPTEPVVWTAARIQKALDGDKAERAALELALNVTLEGKPLLKLSTRALFNGIIVETPVSVDTEINGRLRKVTGPFQQAYKPRVLQDLEKAIKEKSFDDAGLAREYGAIAAPFVARAEGRENVAATLRELINPALAGPRVAKVAGLLKASVVVNSKMIAGASYRPRDTNDGRVYDLTIRLNEDGRKRLWKYSHDRVGTQILLVADGTAIAAPRISFPLSQGELVISQMRDEGLVKDAVTTINGPRSVSSR